MADIVERLREWLYDNPACMEAADEIERLRKGIQDYLDGNYEHPRNHRPDLGECKHGIPWYAECACCDCDHFTALLIPPAERVTPSPSASDQPFTK